MHRIEFQKQGIMLRVRCFFINPDLKQHESYKRIGGTKREAAGKNL